jgi:hypothetical protein
MRDNSAYNTPVNYTRWRLLQTPWLSIYIHRINEEDTSFHNHEWDFLSIILKGKLRELNLDSDGHFRFDIRVRKFLSTRLHKATRYHYMKLSNPVWFLCICGNAYNKPSIPKLKSRPKKNK